jgi:hypothetical protein
MGLTPDEDPSVKFTVKQLFTKSLTAVEPNVFHLCSNHDQKKTKITNSVFQEEFCLEGTVLIQTVSICGGFIVCNYNFGII